MAAGVRARLRAAGPTLGAVVGMLMLLPPRNGVDAGPHSEADSQAGAAL
jgi:hypothetical protein